MLLVLSFFARVPNSLLAVVGIIAGNRGQERGMVNVEDGRNRFIDHGTVIDIRFRFTADRRSSSCSDGQISQLDT